MLKLLPRPVDGVALEERCAVDALSVVEDDRPVDSDGAMDGDDDSDGVADDAAVDEDTEVGSSDDDDSGVAVEGAVLAAVRREAVLRRPTGSDARRDAYGDVSLPSVRKVDDGAAGDEPQFAISSDSSRVSCTRHRTGHNGEDHHDIRWRSVDAARQRRKEGEGK